MGSNSKSGLNKEQRERALRDLGFEPGRNGKGSHVIWEHAELKQLAQGNTKITCPANLLGNASQAMWETTLPDNPAGNTWRTILKHAKWCQDTVETVNGKGAEMEKRRQTCREFREARRDVCEWIHETRLRLKAGIELKEPPKAYRELPRLKDAFMAARDQRIAENVVIHAAAQRKLATAAPAPGRR